LFKNITEFYNPFNTVYRSAAKFEDFHPIFDFD
jgi:hypothetical protein